MRFPPLPALVVTACIFVGCRSESERQPAIGTAHVGPISVNIRAELGPRASTVLTAKHGEKLEIIGRRRRFLRVRAANGVEGWLDSRQLLTAEQMRTLDSLAGKYRGAPSMGSATVVDSLNVHTEPNRQSPSFYRIVEPERVEVLAHVLAPRVPYVSPLAAAAPKPKPAPPKRKKKESKLEPPPMPRPPSVPDDWLEMSKTVVEEMPEPVEEEPERPKPPPPQDEWNLVRLKSGKVGWVLMRNLVLAIPDEVAQYAEGHRITSYFSLGEVRDGYQVKHNWLWTTQSRSQVPYEFDSFRVFVYSLRRHRYETAYIQRNVRGYYPVAAWPASESKPASFAVVLEGDDGRLYQYRFAFQGYLVTLMSKLPWEPAKSDEMPQIAHNTPTAAEEKSAFDRLKEKLFGR